VSEKGASRLIDEKSH